jgi:hypothetical protein
VVEISFENLLFIADAPDFLVHSTRQHKPHHFVIRDKRPERIFKRRGFVFLDKKMRNPRESVARHQAQRQIIPGFDLDEPDQQNQGERRADKMKPARQRIAVFQHVEIPEVAVIIDFPVVRRHTFPLIADAETTAAIKATTTETPPPIIKIKIKNVAIFMFKIYENNCW